MPWHTVKNGEDLAQLLSRLNVSFQIDTIKAHPENTALFERRHESVLMAGDKVFIPEPTEHAVNAATGITHRFRRLGRRRLQLDLYDDKGDLLLGDYQLRVGASWRSGTITEEDGFDEPIPATINTVTLLVQGYEIILEVGTLDPIEEVTGIQARLTNLGFFPGPTDGIFGSRTEAEVRAFQKGAGLLDDGVVGPKTRKKLTTEYGC